MFAEHSHLTTQIQAIYEQDSYHDPAYASAHYQAWDEAKAILRRQGFIHPGEFDILLMEYLSLSIDDALNAESPLVRTVAITDSRLGNRRLRSLANTTAREHSLVKLLYTTRCAAEGFGSQPGA